MCSSIFCYYQAIDFAIQRGLKNVEAGAQGEHKLARGYLPQTTWSAHFIADPDLRRAIADYLKRERAYVAEAGRELAAAAMKAFKADGITIQQFNERAGGQVVFHLHMHVMPRHDGVALLPPASRKEDVKVLEDNATKLIAALQA